MELFRPLTDFYDAIALDDKIDPLHIGVCMALLQKLNLNAVNPILIFGKEIIMGLKINARYTYNKFRNNVDEYDSMCYYPSVNGIQEAMYF